MSALPTFKEPRPTLLVIDRSFPGEADLGTAVSAALMQRVARGEIGETIRLHRTDPVLVFGRLDKLRPGYGRAVAIAREHGYEPVLRLGGGHAAAFHEGTVSLSRASRHPGTSGASGSYGGTRGRFEEMAATVTTALRALGIDARTGEVPGEYCPGEFSVNARGEVKLAGIGQRVISGGAHTGCVIVVHGGGRIRAVLEPVYEALELDWDPRTAGSVAGELDEEDLPGPDGPYRLIERTVAAIREVLSQSFELHDSELDDETRQLAAELRSDHAMTI
ncbi:MAG: lipoate--protein ligase family protein [Solirubrobacterales bacterium]|nr:lipoate--protein ligase family protein [Solirubrobacterales bacterium]